MSDDIDPTLPVVDESADQFNVTIRQGRSSVFYNIQSSNGYEENVEVSEISESVEPDDEIIWQKLNSSSSNLQDNTLSIIPNDIVTTPRLPEEPCLIGSENMELINNNNNNNNIHRDSFIPPPPPLESEPDIVDINSPTSIATTINNNNNNNNDDKINNNNIEENKDNNINRSVSNLSISNSSDNNNSEMLPLDSPPPPPPQVPPPKEIIEAYKSPQNSNNVKYNTLPSQRNLHNVQVESINGKKSDNNNNDIIYSNGTEAAKATNPNFIGNLIVEKGKIGATSVKRTAHVTYDLTTGQFTGVPKEWQNELNKVFGLPLQLSVSLIVPGYKGRIPPVLEEMKKYLINNGGLNVKGIFRLAPDHHECAIVKEQLNNKTFVKCSDVNVIANLLKVWFRDMPARLLDVIKDMDLILNTETPEEAGKIILDNYNEPHLSVLLWLLDLCCIVASNSEVNSMPPQNMAIVFAPNLFKLADAGPTSNIEPTKLMAICKKYTSFFEKCILWRMNSPDRVK